MVECVYILGDGCFVYRYFNPSFLKQAPMTKANRKKIAKELLAAGERIELKYNSLCCLAIDSDDAELYFRKLFKEDAVNLHKGDDIWFESKDEDGSQKEVRSRRVLGLCWAALMAEEGVF